MELRSLSLPWQRRDIYLDRVEITPHTWSPQSLNVVWSALSFSPKFSVCTNLTPAYSHDSFRRQSRVNQGSSILRRTCLIHISRWNHLGFTSTWYTSTYGIKAAYALIRWLALVCYTSTDPTAGRRWSFVSPRKKRGDCSSSSAYILCVFESDACNQGAVIVLLYLTGDHKYRTTPDMDGAIVQLARSAIIMFHRLVTTILPQSMPNNRLSG